MKVLDSKFKTCSPEYKVWAWIAHVLGIHYTRILPSSKPRQACSLGQHQRLGSPHQSKPTVEGIGGQSAVYSQ